MINLNKSSFKFFYKFHALFSIFDTIKCIFCQLWANFPFAFNKNSALSSQLLKNYKTSKLKVGNIGLPNPDTQKMQVICGVA